MRRSVERPIGGCRLLGAGSHFYFALKERWQEGSREGEKKGREEEEQRERKVRGSREREAGQQRSASAKQAKNNGQLEVEGPQLLKICSRDLAPKSRQLALSVTSLLAQVLRADWVTGCTTLTGVLDIVSFHPHAGVPTEVSAAFSPSASTALSLVRGPQQPPSTEQTPKPSMLQVQACACLACCLS